MSKGVAAPLCAALSLSLSGAARADTAPASILTPAPAASAQPAPAPAGIVLDSSAADQEAIKARLRDWVGGMVSRDAAAMGRVLAGDFQTITYGGALVDRSGDIAALTASPDFVVEAVTTKEVDVRVYGDAAVVRALFALIERRGGKVSTVPVRITQTWIRQAGEWRAVADQATRVDPAQAWTPPPEPAAPITVGAAPPNG